MNKNIASLAQAQSLGCIPPCVATMVSLVPFISSLVFILFPLPSLISYFFWWLRHKYGLSLLWLMPGCDNSCPGNDPTFEDWERTSTTAVPDSTYLTSLVGRVHARVHYEHRWQQ